MFEDRTDPCISSVVFYLVKTIGDLDGEEIGRPLWLFRSAQCEDQERERRNGQIQHFLFNGGINVG